MRAKAGAEGDDDVGVEVRLTDSSDTINRVDVLCGVGRPFLSQSSQPRPAFAYARAGDK
ncbi:MAG: hypothetical protein M1401_11250 [Chloroflexi bacterium]|nr:hypothetical protein [Chloroflexota bacterium]MCL5109422.1 hypothetical protein [Chloroflexota bacterium]